MQDKVTAIRILSAEDAQTEVGRIGVTDIPIVVAAVLDAPVDQSRDDFELTSFVEFQLTDGIMVVRGFSAGNGMFQRGITLTPDARSILDATKRQPGTSSR